MKTNELVNKVKVSEATGRVLDYLVAVASGGHGLWHDTVATWWVKIDGDDRALNAGWAQSYLPSIDWSEGGPIIEREKISVVSTTNGHDWAAKGAHNYSYGPTPLIAAMRCFCASKLGDKAYVPKELK